MNVGSGLPHLATYDHGIAETKENEARNGLPLVPTTKPLAHSPALLWDTPSSSPWNSTRSSWPDHNHTDAHSCVLQYPQQINWYGFSNSDGKFTSVEEQLHRTNKSIGFSLVSLIYAHSNSFPTILYHCTFLSFSLLHIICQFWLPPRSSSVNHSDTTNSGRFQMVNKKASAARNLML